MGFSINTLFNTYDSTHHTEFVAILSFLRSPLFSHKAVLDGSQDRVGGFILKQTLPLVRMFAHSNNLPVFKARSISNTHL